jgi:hypothetical protein
MQQFWVVGGDQKGTNTKVPDSSPERWFGPFVSYQEAKQEWARRAWRGSTEVHPHYRIESIDPDQPPPCTD